MMTTDIGTNEHDLHIVYGKDYMGEEVSPLALASVKYMFTDLTDLRKYYIRLGFHLNEFYMNKGYQEFGYSTLEEFCEANLQMDKSSVSRCINVFREFSGKDDVRYSGGIKTTGCAMELSDRWKDYTYTQLVEMLPLSDDDRKMISPDMSCSQIREFKKALKQKTKLVASTQPETTEEEPKKQPKRFSVMQYIRKSGIVAQNYVKSCDSIKHGVEIMIFDKRGKKVLCDGHLGYVLEQLAGCLVIRMYGAFDPASFIPNPDQKGNQHEQV